MIIDRVINGLPCLPAAIVGMALCAAAVAFAYPSKPIRMIQPYAPGGGVETQARAVGKYLNEVWGQPVVIDSRAGAGSALGTQIVANSAPDGYTLLFTNGAFSIVPNLSRNPLFDPLRDFEPIVHVGTMGPPDYALAHEVGHLQGGRHTPESDPNQEPFLFGHAFRNEEIRTIVGTGGQKIVPYFSGPDLVYEGAVLGDSTLRNNAEVLRRSAVYISNFRGPVTPTDFVPPSTWPTIDIN